MTKRSRRQREEQEQMELIENHDPRFPKVKKPLAPRNEMQARYIHTIGDNVVTFATGPAGTGKTHIPTALAAAALDAGVMKKIILTRPAVGAEEDLGFLPGELDEKYEPYLGPFIDIFHDTMGASEYEYAVKAGQIVGQPLAFMRGRTFRDSFVILDEAQNVTPKQMLMFLTRVGPNCRVVVCGDLKQVDIENSGLPDALRRMRHVRRCGFIEFGVEDIVRHGFVQDVVEAYEK
jgi:phosphate starvation-inducible PhoH-like protein